MAATLWAGPESAVSHRSAAALWKLDGIEADGVVELTARCRNPDVPAGITLHRSKLLTPSEAPLKAPDKIRTPDGSVP
ncbi:MAG TPA: hypothetical protein VJ010_07835 [Actinomycetota bacterium]|nr:hypothetical protein [Actinomycetota bacterium]